MRPNRRNFIKNAGLTGMAFAATAMTNNSAEAIRTDSPGNFPQRFNMCGYRAPKLETVRVGFIGLGNRGPTHVDAMRHIEGVDIRALCDLREDRVSAVRKSLEGSNHTPGIFTGTEQSWKKLCESNDVDAVYIATPWALHTPIAVYAMQHGKHAFIEVPAAKTIDECWQLVETSEKYRRHCMILENCCYDFFELLTLSMVRDGYLGEVVHGEGAYIHDLLDGNFSKEKYFDMWRLKENFRNGNLYPTHGLGPVSQVMNINRGETMDFLVSMQSADFMMGAMANALASHDDFYKPYANKKYRGNMNTTFIRTRAGKTILLEHDVTSPNIYSRIYKISGTKGSALKYPLPGKYGLTHEEDWLNDEEIKKIEEKYTPPIIRKIGEMARTVGGHGGMDFLMNWRTMDCLRNGLPLDIDVYDAALWSAISPLTEWSVANGSKPIAIPDFTGGSWEKNIPVDITLKEGGTTRVI